MRHARLKLFLALSVMLWPAAAAGQPGTGLLFRSVTIGNTSYRYEVYVPPGWTKQKNWPVILFLHGAGHRGEYDAGQATFVLGERFLRYWRKPEAMVVMPRCRANAWWSDPEMEAMALAALEQTIQEFRGDPARVYLTGLSMGGYGTWFLAARHAGRFAAIAPVCAGIRTPATIGIPPVSTARDPYADVARRIGKTPVWAFHGSADEVINVNESRRMVAALKTSGGSVRFTEYAGVGHNSWDRAYAEPEFFPWLLAQRLRKVGAKSEDSQTLKKTGDLSLSCSGERSRSRFGSV